jgi:hypothetical protein
MNLRCAPLLAVCTLAPGCAVFETHVADPSPRVRGPIPSRTQEPLALTQLAFRPRRATVLGDGERELRITSAYSSMFVNGDTGSERVVLDGEIWRNAFAFQAGFAPHTDIEVELPVVFASDGFLDQFVETWHALLGLPSGGREARPHSDYVMDVEKNGQDLYHLEPNDVGIGDVPIVVAHQFVTETEDVPAVTVRLGVELPVGSASRGFGNGELDYGLGMLAEKSLGRWTLTAGVDWVDTHRPDSFTGSGVELNDVFDLQTGAEYRWNDSVSLLAGLTLQSAITDDFSIKEIDREIASFDLGVAFDTGVDSTLSIGFEEDLIAKSGPDFTVFASWTTGL